MLWLLPLIFTAQLWSKPYHRPERIIAPSAAEHFHTLTAETITPSPGSAVLRIEVQWHRSEAYSLQGVYQEQSGTPALLANSRKLDPLGSFKGSLKFKLAGQTHTLYSSIGTGKEFRQLVRTLSFRFPWINQAADFEFELTAENPQTGKMEVVLKTPLRSAAFQRVPTQAVKVFSIRKALTPNPLKVNFYAEGFKSKGEQHFLESAKKAVATLEKNLPGHEHFEFQAVFAPSRQALGSAQDHGPDIKARNSFLGLYFPYWRKFGRWYHVVYPTDQTRYRNALAQVAYDYPIALIDDAGYWGVGNYKELTAIPTRNGKFAYLLLHEFGHFMGLNEEYEGGGPTELEFSANIQEPWSQNITFNPGPDQLKWKGLTAPGIALPSSRDDYHRHGGSKVNPVGAYRGGYADSEPQAKSHKPVLQCMMSSGGPFCPVCSQAIKDLIDQDRM
jgi:hypothetical protein